MVDQKWKRWDSTNSKARSDELCQRKWLKKGDETGLFYLSNETLVFKPNSITGIIRRKKAGGLVLLL